MPRTQRARVPGARGRRPMAPGQAHEGCRTLACYAYCPSPKQTATTAEGRRAAQHVQQHAAA
eukprot:6279979-Alexandrium_andersonii.AAC.1